MGGWRGSAAGFCVQCVSGSVMLGAAGETMVDVRNALIDGDWLFNSSSWPYSSNDLRRKEILITVELVSYQFFFPHPPCKLSNWH